MTTEQSNTKNSKEKPLPEHKTALILGGGGARAAYQVGVLKAIAELVPKGSRNPFPIICGTSAGSINTVALASNASNFHHGVEKILQVWSNFELKQVFHVDGWHLFGRIGHWIWAHFSFGNTHNGPGSILDNQPLRQLLSKYMSFEKIDKALESGDLHAYCLTACSYTSGESTTFFDGHVDIQEWLRTHREGLREKITLDHMMASSAIPVVFESVKIGDEYFGDGSMRQINPISPAIHLGADRILTIGLRKETDIGLNDPPKYRPTLGQISGYVLDTLFLNSLQSDVERMNRVNRMIKNGSAADTKHLKVIDHFLINPSQDIADIAVRYYKTLPRCFRITLSFLGINKGNSRRFMSYLMFIKPFCEELIDLGYKDAMQQRDALQQFLLESSKSA